jgi:uncharacterized membrane protein YdcZ (DUF606 family)
MSNSRQAPAAARPHFRLAFICGILIALIVALHIAGALYLGSSKAIAFYIVAAGELSVAKQPPTPWFFNLRPATAIPVT